MSLPVGYFRGDPEICAASGFRRKVPIFPSCAPCNLLKTTYSLEMFRKQVSLQVERGRRSSVNFRTAERFGLISVVNKPVVFWFEQYEGENK